MKPVIEQKISVQKLIDFSGEHLYYEIKQLYGVMERLLAGEEDLYRYNALLESFVLHASVILDFFYKPAIKYDDARAEHYMRDPKAWKKALPAFSKKFGDFTRKRNKEVMHLSYKRLNVQPGEKRWDSPKITKEIGKVVDLFLDHAAGECLHPRIYELRSTNLKQSLQTGPYA